MHSTTRQASATKRSRRAHSRPNSLQHHDRIDKRASTTKLSTNRQSSAPTGSKRWNCRKLNKRISNLIILLLSVQVMVCFVDIGSHFEIKTKATLLKANNYTALFQKDTSSRSIVTANRTNPAYAYAFLIAGCDPAMTRSHHRGFLYNVLVSAKILKDLGSQADIVLLVQMSAHSSEDELPKEETRFLRALDIRIIYIPKSPAEVEGFYDSMLQKFRILALTEYRRVISLDSDVMPLQNLDFIFHLSEGPNAVLKENMICAGLLEPANGGFFMLTPRQGEYEQVVKIINMREHTALRDTGGSFDVVRGWGHKIEAPDEWSTRTKGRTGRLWDFHGAFVDQGLLYHWTKYIKKSMSAVYEDHVENWASLSDGSVFLEKKLKNPFREYATSAALLTYSYESCVKFMCSFYHFTGQTKPWLSGPKGKFRWSWNKDPAVIWWDTLHELNTQLNMRIDFERFSVGKPTFGFFPGVDSDKEHALRNQGIRNKAYR